jgi:hypothetical protein
MRRVLRRNCLIAALFMVVFTVLVWVEAPFPALLAAAVALGVTLAGMFAGFRALLYVVVTSASRRHAHFVESMMVEFGYGVGPVVVGGAYFVAGVEAALLAMAACFVAATLLLRRVPAMPPIPSAVSGRPRMSRSLVALSGLGLCASAGFGLVEGSVALRMGELGWPASASAAYLLLLSIGSCIGGLVVSMRPLQPARPLLAVAGLLLVFAVTVLPQALCDGPIWYALFLPIASLPLVPLTGLASSLLEAQLGAENRGAAFGLFLTGCTVGGGFGVAMAGVIAGLTRPDVASLAASALYAVVGCGALIAHSVIPRVRRHGAATNVGPQNFEVGRGGPS